MEEKNERDRERERLVLLKFQMGKERFWRRRKQQTKRDRQTDRGAEGRELWVLVLSSPLEERGSTEKKILISALSQRYTELTS